MANADSSYKATGGRRTKFASIPEAPSDLSPGAKKFLEAVKETVEVREGKRGNPLDRSIIVRDLLDPEFTTKYWPGGGTSNPNTDPTPSPGDRDTTPPGPVTGFNIDPSDTDSNYFTWGNPTDEDLNRVELYCAAVNPAIPTWASGVSCSQNDLYRYPIHGLQYVFKWISTTSRDDIAPDDSTHGYAGSGTKYWTKQRYPYKTFKDARRLAIIPQPTEHYTHELESEVHLESDFYYWALAVDDSGNKSPTTPASSSEGLFAASKTSVVIVPTPQGLHICGTGSEDTFNDLDVKICWDPSDNPFIVDYEIEILTGHSSPVTRRLIRNIRGCTYTYEYSLNQLDGSGTAEDELTIRLWAVNIYHIKSDDYAEIQVTNPAPANVGTITSQQWFRAVRFKWEPNTDIDLDGYELYAKVADGDPVTSQPYSAWQPAWTSSPTLHQDLDSAHFEHLVSEDDQDLYGDYGGPYVYIQVRAVDTWGNVSAAWAYGYGAPGAPIDHTELEGFHQIASEMFDVPVLSGDVWNTSGDALSWSAHSLYYGGKRYAIQEGTCTADPDSETTPNRYIYWRSIFKDEESSGTEDDPYVSKYEVEMANPEGDPNSDPPVAPPTKNPVWGDDDFLIAINYGNGSYDKAWHAFANAVIGSAYIMKAAIHDAHIVNLNASKITAGTLQSTYWDTDGGAYFNLDAGTFKLGDKDDPSLEWDGTDLILKGAIIQSERGDDFCLPVYRGAYPTTEPHAGWPAIYKWDLYTYGGSSWLYVNDTITPLGTQRTPADNDWWDVYSQAGSTGIDGQDGSDGIDGAGVTYRGEWAQDVNYVGETLIKDIVKHSGIFYICRYSHISGRGGLIYATRLSPATDVIATDAVWTGTFPHLPAPSQAQAVSQIFLSAKDANGNETSTTVEIAVLGTDGNVIYIASGVGSNTHTIPLGRNAAYATLSFDAVTIAGLAVKNTGSFDIEINYMASYSNHVDFDQSAPGVSTALWSSFGATFESVATDLLLANDITLLKTLTFGSDVSGGQLGVIRSYNKPTYTSSASWPEAHQGFWLGFNDNIPKVNIGNRTNHIVWDGTDLYLKGEIIGPDNIEAGAFTGSDTVSGTTTDWSYYMPGDYVVYYYLCTLTVTPSSVLSKFILTGSASSAGTIATDTILYGCTPTWVVTPGRITPVTFVLFSCSEGVGFGVYKTIRIGFSYGSNPVAIDAQSARFPFVTIGDYYPAITSTAYSLSYMEVKK